jgi:hypothetical protein
LPSVAGPAAVAVQVWLLIVVSPEPDKVSAPMILMIGESFGLPGKVYVTSAGGLTGVGQLPGIGGTSGSTITTNTFSANAGDALSFYFNYVTTDGANFTDYAWAQLLGSSATVTLFTARTTTSGNAVPGFGLPDLAAGVTLTPASTPIIPGAPTWSPLGSQTGQCLDAGCGYTGWIKMDYVIAAAGDDQLGFGVSNWSDAIWDSGMAIVGTTINDVPIDAPEPAALGLLGTGIFGFGLSRRRRA